MNNRQEYNKKIIEVLQAKIDKYPDLRFIQLLQNVRLITWEKKV